MVNKETATILFVALLLHVNLVFSSYAATCRLDLGWDAYLNNQHCDCNYANDQDTSVLTQEVADIDDEIMGWLIGQYGGFSSVITDNAGNVLCLGVSTASSGWKNKSAIIALDNCTSELVPGTFTVYNTVEPDPVSGGILIGEGASRVVYAARRSSLSKRLCYSFPLVTFKELADSFCGGYPAGCIDVRGPYMESEAIRKIENRCP